MTVIVFFGRLNLQRHSLSRSRTDIIFVSVSDFDKTFDYRSRLTALKANALRRLAFVLRRVLLRV